jgi:hypothetical protein
VLIAKWVVKVCTDKLNESIFNNIVYIHFYFVFVVKTRSLEKLDPIQRLLNSQLQRQRSGSKLERFYIGEKDIFVFKNALCY